MRKNRGDDRGDRACGRKLRQNNSRKTRANETDAQQKGRQRVSRQESRMNDWHCVRWGSTLTLASTPTNPSSIVARIRNFRQCQLGITKILRAIVACIMHTADAQKKKHRTQLYYATWWSVHFFSFFERCCSCIDRIRESWKNAEEEIYSPWNSKDTRSTDSWDRPIVLAINSEKGERNYKRNFCYARIYCCN